MFGFLSTLADAMGGKKLKTEAVSLDNRLTLKIHLKDRKGRTYLHFNFGSSDNYVFETDHAEALLGVLKEYRERM